MIERKLLFSPGPVITTETVKKAALSPDICHRSPMFEELYAKLRKDIVKLFKANEEEYLSVVVSGSGTASNEMILSSTVDQEDKVLLVTNGEFGNRLKDIINCYQIDLVEIKYEWGKYPDLNQIESALKNESKIKLIAVVFHETSTGMINPVGEIGKLAKRYNKLFFVDAISAVGGEDVNMVRDNIDFCTGVPNKSVAGPPGLSFACVNRSAIEQIKNVKRKNIYLNLQAHIKFAEENNQTPNTPEVVQFIMLQKALDELFEEGLENRIKRYKKLSNMIRQDIRDMGLKMLIDDESIMSNTVTSVFLPESISVTSFIDRMDREGYVLYPGKGPLLDKNMFQIANMGHLTEEDTRNMLDTIKKILQSSK